MARAHGVAIVASIAIGTTLWFLLARADEQAPPWQPPPTGGRTQAADAADVPPEGAPIERADRRALPGPEVAPAPESTPADEGTAAPSTDPVAPPGIDVRVRDIRSHEPIARFQWTFQPSRPMTDDVGPLRGVGEAGAFALPVVAAGRLLVEAERYEPSLRDIELRPGAPTPIVEVFLARAAVAAGVSITATDATGAALDRLRIDLWRIAPEQPDPAPDIDPSGPTMWSRVGVDAGGAFHLPALTAGRYALRAQPCAADGTPLPLQPRRGVFAFAGHEAVPLTFTFEPGLVLAVEADEVAAPPRDLRAIVRGTDGSPTTVVWRSVTTEGAIVATDLVTLPQRATSLLALPPGQYALELQQGDRPVVVIPTPAEPARRLFRATLPR